MSAHDSIRHLLTRESLRCPMAITRDGIEDACNKPGTTLAYIEWEGQRFLQSMCTYHANRAGRANAVRLEDIVEALR